MTPYCQPLHFPVARIIVRNIVPCPVLGNVPEALRIVKAIALSALSHAVPLFAPGHPKTRWVNMGVCKALPSSGETYMCGVQSEG